MRSRSWRAFSVGRWPVDSLVCPRFSRIGDFDAIHYPTGFTMGRTKLAALAEALVIKRRHLANTRVVDAWLSQRVTASEGRERMAAGGGR